MDHLVTGAVVNGRTCSVANEAMLRIDRGTATQNGKSGVVDPRSFRN